MDEILSIFKVLRTEALSSPSPSSSAAPPSNHSKPAPITPSSRPRQRRTSTPHSCRDGGCANYKSSSPSFQFDSHQAIPMASTIKSNSSNLTGETFAAELWRSQLSLWSVALGTVGVCITRNPSIRSLIIAMMILSSVWIVAVLLFGSTVIAHSLNLRGRKEGPQGNLGDFGEQGAGCGRGGYGSHLRPRARSSWSI